MEHKLRALVMYGVIAPSGRHVRKRVRLAGAWACLACVRRFAGGLRASARQFVSSQMRYNGYSLPIVGQKTAKNQLNILPYFGKVVLSISLFFLFKVGCGGFYCTNYQQVTK